MPSGQLDRLRLREWCVQASWSSTALQKSGRSLGRRDVIMLPSTTTGASTYSALTASKHNSIATWRRQPVDQSINEYVTRLNNTWNMTLGDNTRLRPPQARATTNSQHWFTTSFLQPLPYLVTPKGPENSVFRCRSNSSTFVTNNSNKTKHVKVYTSTNKSTIVRIETELSLVFFTRGGCVSFSRACFGARLLLQSY